ncbi:MAG TPA: TIGR03790 family protein [Thermoguttaceae bacterium]|nr:TIGR03790 family protein [Thermoguttaceae bacterium]
MFRAFSRPWLLLPTLAICLAAGFPEVARAGGGPENVFLVVNRDSPGSMTIANHYIRLRDIPACNVLALSWDPATDKTDVDAFRQRILRPVLTAIDQRRLAQQIDYIVYSSDFPWQIGVKADVDRAQAELQAVGATTSDDSPDVRPWPQHLTPYGSINGLTYLWQPVMAGKATYMQLDANRYMRLPFPEQKDQPTLGFRSTQQFGRRGELLDGEGRRYMLSMVLGVTTDRGNTVAEVLGYLERSAGADGTHPRGTIYYCQNDNVRSTTRDKVFPRAVSELEELGVAAEILQARVPQKKEDIQGCMIGWSGFKWHAYGNVILPGAICEHLTSWGGVMSEPGYGHSPLSEFLRYGAAGASGTVYEPYSLQAKFPLAMIHVHYARGCTLAEAFYQSVYGPYQLLIVGDPLCRPWANIPEVAVQGVQGDATVQGTLTLEPSATIPGDSKVDRFELFIDGWRRAACRVGESFTWDTTRLADGYHEFRVVAVEAGLIQSQGRKDLPIYTANHGRKITASIEPTGNVKATRPLVVTAESPGSVGIVVLHNSREVGKITGENGRVTIDPTALGTGPVRLRVVGIGQGGPSGYVMAPPFDLTIATESE